MADLTGGPEQRAERWIEREKGLKARGNEVNTFLREGGKYRKEHEQRIREGKGSGPWALAAADDVDDVEQKRKENRQRKNAERKAKIAEEKKKKAAEREQRAASGGNNTHSPAPTLTDAEKLA